MLEINDKNYNKEIFLKTHELPFIIFFKSNTCSYCPIVEEYLSKIEKDKNKPCEFNIYKVQAEQSLKLISKYEVRSLPFTLFFDKNKNVVGNITGAEDIYEFIKIIEKKMCKKKDQNFITKIKNFFKV